MEVDVHHGVSAMRQVTNSRRLADQVQHVVEVDVHHGVRARGWEEAPSDVGTSAQQR